MPPHILKKHCVYDMTRIAFEGIFHHLHGLKCKRSIAAAFVDVCMDNVDVLRKI